MSRQRRRSRALTTTSTTVTRSFHSYAARLDSQIITEVSSPCAAPKRILLADAQPTRESAMTEQGTSSRACHPLSMAGRVGSGQSWGWHDAEPAVKACDPLADGADRREVHRSAAGASGIRRSQ